MLIERYKHFRYAYLANDFPEEGTDCDHGGYGDQEPVYRELPSEISYCHDVLQLKPHIPLDEDDLLQGCLYHLKLMLSRINDRCNLQIILQEFIS